MTEKHTINLQTLMDAGIFQWNWRGIWERHYGRLFVLGARLGIYNIPAE